MIKINLLLSVLAISLVLCAVAVYAEEINPDTTTLQDLQEKKDQAENIKNQIEQDKTAFLLNSWEEFLSKTPLGRIIIQIGGFLEFISPVFVVFVGMPYELSWLFFISAIVAAWLFTLLYRGAKLATRENGLIAAVLSLAVLGILVRGSMLQNAILFFSPIFSNSWVSLLTIVIGSAIVLAYNIIMKKVEKKMEEQKKKELEDQREADRKTLDKINEVKIVAAGGKTSLK